MFLIIVALCDDSQKDYMTTILVTHHTQAHLRRADDGKMRNTKPLRIVKFFRIVR